MVKKLAYVGTKRTITPAKYSDYRLAARARYKRKTGRAPSPAQMHYWTRSFKIKKPAISITRDALRAVAERMAGKYQRKHGKMPTADQLRYWTRAFQIAEVEEFPDKPAILSSIADPSPGDEFRFTYEIGGYMDDEWFGIRLVRYGRYEDSWSLDMMEKEAEIEAGKSKNPFSIYDLSLGGTWSQDKKGRAVYTGTPATEKANYSGPEPIYD